MKKLRFRRIKRALTAVLLSTALLLPFKLKAEKIYPKTSVASQLFFQRGMGTGYEAGFGLTATINFLKRLSINLNGSLAGDVNSGNMILQSAGCVFNFPIYDPVSGTVYFQRNRFSGEQIAAGGQLNFHLKNGKKEITLFAGGEKDFDGPIPLFLGANIPLSKLFSMYAILFLPVNVPEVYPRVGGETGLTIHLKKFNLFAKVFGVLNTREAKPILANVQTGMEINF